MIIQLIIIALIWPLARGFSFEKSVDKRWGERERKIHKAFTCVIKNN